MVEEDPVEVDPVEVVDPVEEDPVEVDLVEVVDPVKVGPIEVWQNWKLKYKNLLQIQTKAGQIQAVQKHTQNRPSMLRSPDIRLFVFWLQ